jgi:hypothetical protein
VAGVSDSFTGPTRQGAESDSYKGLETGAYGGLGQGYVFALFDNVYINNQATVYDDFSTAPLDQTNWKSDEEVREIANGKLRLNRLGFDEQSQITLKLSDYNTPYLETKVRIESSSQLSAGARGIARIQGHYYNDSRGPGSGQDHNRNEGDVWVEIRLQLEDNGNLKAQAIVERSNDANQATWTGLLSQYFSTPINFDTDYVLSIEFKGSMLTLKCNDETISYPISTPTYTPFGEHRSLRSIVYLDDTESGYIKAQFDDVYVEQAQATYDATGEWNFASSNTWAIGGAGCDPDEPGTYFSTIIQTGNNVTLAVHHPDTDEDDTMFNGIVSGDTYYLTTTFGEDGGTQTINVIFTLSSETSGTGKVTWTWTDGVETCNGGSDITFLKQGSLQPLPGDDGGGGGGGCFIATAAYGSPMQPYVVILREFRDHILLKSGIGKTFVQFYYKYSPPMADFIAEHANMRAIVRVSLLPIVGMSWLAMKIGLVSTIALMLLFAFGLISLVRVRKKPNR